VPIQLTAPAREGNAPSPAVAQPGSAGQAATDVGDASRARAAGALARGIRFFAASVFAAQGGYRAGVV